MIEIQCSGCAQKFSVADEHPGQTSRCPKCNMSLVVPEVAAPATPGAMHVIQPPEDENNMYNLLEDDGSYEPPPMQTTTYASSNDEEGKMHVIMPPENEEDMYDLMENDAYNPPPPEWKKCPTCKNRVVEEVAICIECGYDFRAGEKLSQDLQGVTFATANKVLLLTGTWYCLVSGAIGAVIWILMATKLEEEYNWMAWVIGAFCGFAMTANFQQKYYVAGVIAAVVSLVSVMTAKHFVFQSFVHRIAEMSGNEEFANQFGFWHAFRPVDGVFATLACVTAYKIGSGKRKLS